MNSLMNQVEEPSQPAVDEVTLATNADNLFAIGTWLASTTEESVAFMTRFQVEVVLKKRKEKASGSMIELDLKPPYPSIIEMKPYQLGYVAPRFKKFYGIRGNTCEHIIRFLDSVELILLIRICASGNSQNLSVIAHTRGMWILGLDLSMIGTISSSKSILNSSSCWRSRKNLLKQWIRFIPEQRLDYCDLVAEDFCWCLPSWNDWGYWVYIKISLLIIFTNSRGCKENRWVCKRGLQGPMQQSEQCQKRPFIATMGKREPSAPIQKRFI